MGERAINRKVAECLVKAGAFDSLHPDRGALLSSFEAVVDQAARQRQALEVGQGFLFDLDEEELPVPSDAPPVEQETLLLGERETLGFYLSGHPLRKWEAVLRELRATPIGELRAMLTAGTEQVTVAGMVTGLRIRALKEGRNQGRRMAIFKLEDETGTVRVVAFSDAFERMERLLAEGVPVLVTAALRSQDGEHVELSAQEASRLEGIETRHAAALRVHIDLERHGGRDDLERIHDLILQHEGRLSVRLRLTTAEWEIDVTPTRVLGVNGTTLVPALAAVLGPDRTEYLFEGNGSGSSSSS